MRAEIISIGTEILLGDIQDTNSHFLAQRLPALGIDLYGMHQIGDNRARLTELLRSARARADLILCTGGLGPTEDDVTRECIAAAMEEEISLDPDLEATLRGFFEARTFPMPERNLKQATLIPSAVALPNPRGTAPGWWVERDETVIVAMPGPPAEMSGMWANEVKPRLAQRPTGTIIVSRTLKTVGVGEGSVDEMLGDLLRGTNPTVGVYAKADGVHVRLTAKAGTEAQAYARIDPVEEQVRNIFGPAVWGADDATLAGALGDLLRELQLSLAVMESCTGGLLATTLTESAGASDFFRGGLVTYTAEAKQHYGVPAETLRTHGVVSEETARAMASAVRRELQADIGVGITGVAGPEPHEGKPVGTVHVAVETAQQSAHTLMTFRQSREAIRRRAVTTALTLLRRAALGDLPT